MHLSRSGTPRVLVVDRLGKGGVYHYSIGLAASLAAEGAAVTLLTTTPREELAPPGGGVRTRRRLLWADSDTRTAALVRELANFALTLWTALASRSRVVVVQLAYPATTDRWAVPLLRLLGRKVVLTCHNLGWHEREGRIESHGLAAYRRADAVVTLSEYERGRLVAAAPELASRSRVVPHGDLDFLAGARPEQSTARRRLGLAETGPLLLFFGYLKEYKGVDVLVEAAAVLRDRGRPIPVLVAGQGEADVVDALANRVRRLGLDDLVDVRAGYVPAEDAAAYFAGTDAVVLPYRRATQSGVVQFAYAHARPVVVTEVGGLAEDVVAGETGELAPPEDPEALADAIERLVGDPDRLTRIQEALRSSPPARNRWDSVAREYLALIGCSGAGAPVVVWVTDVQWDGVWYGAQHLASRLAERGYRVLFCEVPVSVLSPLRDRGRLRQLRHRLRRQGTTLAVDSPIGIPPQDHRRLRDVNAHVYARRIRKVLGRLGWSEPAVIIGRYPYSWRLSAHFPEALFVANLSDATWSTDSADTAELSARLGAADAAVCVSPPLVRRAEGAGVEHVLLLPQGVDVERVQGAAERGPDAAVAATGKPVVGCLGSITPRTDFALIDRLAAARPDWQFVLVGAAGAMFRELDSDLAATGTDLDERENVHRLPACSPADVGSVVAAFDVAWVPYVWSEFNESSNPLKVWEYLAVGVPVVAPAFPALESMRDVATLVSRGATDAEWLAALETALADDDPSRRTARRTFATANTWERRADTLADFVAGLLPQDASSATRQSSAR